MVLPASDGVRPVSHMSGDLLVDCRTVSNRWIAFGINERDILVKLVRIPIPHSTPSSMWGAWELVKKMTRLNVTVLEIVPPSAFGHLMEQGCD